MANLRSSVRLRGNHKGVVSDSYWPEALKSLRQHPTRFGHSRSWPPVAACSTPAVYQSLRPAVALRVRRRRAVARHLPA
jgi:hypothetical protein